MIPQLLVISIYFLSIGISLAQHGEPKKGNNNAWTTIISAVIMFAILYYGGFFDNLISRF